MASVFISYAREDAAKARTIARALEQASFEVWFDEQIHSGTEFSREIEDALRGAAAVVVLWSTKSVESGWVRDEATEGRDSGRLVPILLDECRPPMGFRQIHATDLSNWSGRGRPKHIDDVIKAVHAKAGVPPKIVAKPTAAVSSSLRRPITWAGAALAVVVVAIVAAWLVTRMGDQRPAAPSIALLPFTAESTDPVARKLAAETHDAVAHTLSQGAFAVRLIDSVPPGRPPADFIITGQLSSEPDRILATIRMENAAHRSLAFSDQFTSSRKEAAGLPERIGAQVAARVAWTAPMIAIERRHPSDPAVLSALLQQRIAVGQSKSALQDYHTARRLVEKAPNSAIAQMNLGFFTGYALGELPRGERAKAVALARRTTDRARALAPEFGEPYIPWCLLHSPVRMVECEDRLRTAIRVDPDAPFPTFFLSQLLNNAGRSAEAAQVASLSLAHDQYMPMKIALMIRMLEATGRTKEATELYRQSTRWWPDNGPINWFRLSGMAMRGDFEAAQRFAKDIADESSPNRALSAVPNVLGDVQEACPSDAAHGFKGTMCMLGLARAGDLDAAFAFADRLYPSRRGRNPADEERLWLDNPHPFPLAFLTAPSAAPLRRDPRYIALANRVGLLGYWRSGRPPDFCRTRPEPICPRLLGSR